MKTYVFVDFKKKETELCQCKEDVEDYRKLYEEQKDDLLSINMSALVNHNFFEGSHVVIDLADFEKQTYQIFKSKF